MRTDFNAKLNFTHGSVVVEGTMIFVLAQIAHNALREGFISATKSPELEEALAAAASTRADDHYIVF